MDRRNLLSGFVALGATAAAASGLGGVVGNTLGKSVLGLSLGCCRCNDHKFDPLTTRDYYGLYGIFDSTRFAFPGCEPKQQPRDLVPLPLSAEQQRLVKGIDEKLAAVDA